MRSKTLARIPPLFFRDRSKKGPMLSDKEIQEFLLGSVPENERNNREITIFEGTLLGPVDQARDIANDNLTGITLSDHDVQDFLVGTNQVNPAASLLKNALSGAYDRVWEITKDQVKIDKGSVLGKGEFYRDYKAVMKWLGKDIEVAVKIPKKKCTYTALKALLLEVKIMTYLGSHSNIVGLIGVYTGELSQGNIYVATEFCSLGSLESFLRRHKCVDRHHVEYENIILDENNNEVPETKLGSTRTKISIKDMIQWSHEIASGMEYLERKGVIHADLATRNILLTSERTAKISAFGLSERMHNYCNYMKTEPEFLPWRWMAIESLTKFEFSSKTDVWSFGVTMWEIFSNGRTPYPGLIWTHDFVHDLSHGLRPTCPPFASPETFKLMQSCWEMDPEKRPNFKELMEYTGSILQNGSDCQ